MVPYNTVFLNKRNGAACCIHFWDEVPALCTSASTCLTAWAKWHWSDEHNLWLFMGPIRAYERKKMDTCFEVHHFSSWLNYGPFASWHFKRENTEDFIVKAFLLFAALQNFFLFWFVGSLRKDCCVKVAVNPSDNTVKCILVPVHRHLLELACFWSVSWMLE